MDRRDSYQLYKTIFRTISDITNTYRGNSMVGVSFNSQCHYYSQQIYSKTKHAYLYMLYYTG